MGDWTETENGAEMPVEMLENGIHNAAKLKTSAQFIDEIVIVFQPNSQFCMQNV